MNSGMRNQGTPSSTTIPFVPWENNGPSPQSHQHNLIEHREYRRRLAGAVRTLLQRQNRAYHRRINQLQERWNQQQQEQMKLSKLAPTGFMENDYVVRLTVDLPGVSKDDIQVQVVTSPLPYELRITAKRSFMSIDSTACVSTNTKSQRYCINHNVVDVTQINAALHNGVLTITAPKKKALNSNGNSITDMYTSKDQAMQEADGNNVTTPMTSGSNQDQTMESSTNGEGNGTNTAIHVAVSEK